MIKRLIIFKKPFIFVLINIWRFSISHFLAAHASFYIALTALILGSQFFVAGFLGDLVSRQNPQRNDYQIEETI